VAKFSKKDYIFRGRVLFITAIIRQAMRNRGEREANIILDYFGFEGISRIWIKKAARRKRHYETREMRNLWSGNGRN
jgi:hypothetical protein